MVLNDYAKLGIAFGVGLFGGALGVHLYYKKTFDTLEETVNALDEEVTKLQKLAYDTMSDDIPEEPVVISREVVAHPEASAKEMDEELTRKDDDEVGGEPYVISSEAFINEHEEYDKVDLVYYAGDKTLVDVQDVKLGHDLVGEYNLQLFDAPSILELYVRDDGEQTDYSIERVNDSFEEIVKEE